MVSDDRHPALRPVTRPPRLDLGMRYTVALTTVHETIKPGENWVKPIGKAIATILFAVTKDAFRGQSADFARARLLDLRNEVVGAIDHYLEAGARENLHEPPPK
jgi:hypothetical protein